MDRECHGRMLRRWQFDLVIAAIQFARPRIIPLETRQNSCEMPGKFVAGERDLIKRNIVAVFVSVLSLCSCAPPPQTTQTVTPVTAAPNQPVNMAVLAQHAQAGDDKSAILLAFLYYRVGNAAAAFNWVQLAANRGNAPAEALLCNAYTRGLGVPQDYSMALKLCRLAVDKNDGLGMNNLAYLYEHGFGVPANLVEADDLYRRGAMLGNVVAQDSLGRFYEHGLGGPVDRQLAYFWDSLAAARLVGPEQMIVAGRRDAMAALLSPAEVAALQGAASKWKPGTEPPAGHAVHPAADRSRSL